MMFLCHSTPYRSHAIFIVLRIRKRTHMEILWVQLSSPEIFSCVFPSDDVYKILIIDGKGPDLSCKTSRRLSHIYLHFKINKLYYVYRVVRPFFFLQH